jgi:hypothetical protein
MAETFADEPTTETAPPSAETTETTTAADAKDDALWDVHSETHPPQVDAGEPEPEPPAPVAAADRNADGTFVAKKAKPRSNPQARVEQATADAAEARRLLAERDAELAQMRAERTAPKPIVATTEPTKKDVADQKTKSAFYGDDVTRPFPNINDFGDDADPVGRMFYEGVKWNAEQERYQAEKRQAQTERTTILTEASQRLSEARTADPAFDGYVQTIEREIAKSGFVGARVDGTSGPALPPALFTALAKSSRIADITRLFGQHPEQCAQWIADTRDLPPSAATVVLRSLEASLPASTAAVRADSASRSPVSAAKPPIDRVGGSASASPADPDDLPFDEFVRTENARELRERKAGLR